MAFWVPRHNVAPW